LPDLVRTSFPDQRLPVAQPLGSCRKSGQPHLALAVFAVPAANYRPANRERRTPGNSRHPHRSNNITPTVLLLIKQ
jgi:hypothetical protein